MATNEDKSHLSRRQIVRLASAISADNMESVAEGYMDLSTETIRNIKRDASNAEAFNRDVIRYWMNKNPDNQIQRLAALLYEAASECAYVNPQKVEEILGMSRQEVTSSPTLRPSFEANVTEEEFLEIAEDLKISTEEIMKIDMAPWAKAYTEVDMAKLYTDLTLEKLENTPAGTKRKTVDYQELFRRCESRAQRKRKGKRVLCKGDPGMGKTTLMKKLGWDWARGIFMTYSMIFFVFLKLVSPGDAIENVIIQQSPDLEGIGITPAKLKGVLEKFSDKCLLILDGLDEHALGKNEDVLEIIRGQKLFYCSIIVTSRPHSTKEVERYFSTIVRVEGFTREKAEQFATCLLGDPEKVEAVLYFKPSDYDDLYKCPIILLILCVLVKEGEIDLNNVDLKRGELYFRLVRFLYQKYATNKGISFDENGFLNVFKKLGKLAWKILKQGDAFLKRSQVIDEVGEEAFEYGLLVGHEDYRLIGKETADVFVAFVHRTLLDFFWSFYLVLKLSEGEKLENLVDLNNKDSIPFAVDRFFLQCCLWFVHSNQTFVSFPDKKLALESLKTFFMTELDQIEFDLELASSRFPALNIKYYSFRRHLTDPVVDSFICELIQTFKKMKHQTFCCGHPVDLILTTLGTNMRHLSSITLNYDGENSLSFLDDALNCSSLSRMISIDLLEQFHCDGELDVVFHVSSADDGLELLNTVLEHCSHWGIAASIFHVRPYKIEVSSYFMRNNVRKIFFLGGPQSDLRCEKPIPRCPNLTHLYFVNIERVEDAFHSELHAAVTQGNLPSITHFCFENVKAPSYGNTFSFLIRCHWPNLTNLNLLECDLKSADVIILSTASKMGLLPKLDTLLVSDSCTDCRTIVPMLFTHSWIGLKTFRVNHLTNNSARKLMAVFGQGRLSDLNELGLHFHEKILPDMSLHVISRYVPKLQCLTLDNVLFSLKGQPTGILFPWKLSQIVMIGCSFEDDGVLTLLQYNFPVLHTLVLSDCGLNSKDLSSLANAKERGRLPELKHLDISNNPEYGGQLGTLFDYCCTWDSLLFLSIQQPFVGRNSDVGTVFCRDVEMIVSKVKTSCLRNIEELSITVYSSQYLTQGYKTSWPYLRKINILTPVCDWESSHDRAKGYRARYKILQPLVDLVLHGSCPALKTISFLKQADPYFRYDDILAADKYFFLKHNICLNISQTHDKRRLKAENISNEEFYHSYGWDVLW